MSGQDVGFFFTEDNNVCPDMVIENGDLKPDNGLETAITISLFTNRRVTLEQLPVGRVERQGWWADTVADVQGDQIGSRLWVLEAEKIIPRTPVDVQNFVSEALQWLIDDGIIGNVDVSAARADGTDTDRVEGTATLRRPDGVNIPFQFIWDGQQLKITEG